MIAIGSDHGGYELKKFLINELKEVDLKDYGTFSMDSVDYPDIAISVAENVANGICERGILVCRSGIGMDMMANKVVGIRAALCFNSKMAEMAKRHEDANVITIGADYVSKEEALEIVKSWLNAEFEGGRHQRRIDKIRDYEMKNNLK